MEPVAVEVSHTTDAAAVIHQRTSTTGAATVVVASSLQQHMTSEQAQVFESGATDGYEGADVVAAGVSAATIQQMHAPTAPPSTAVIVVDATREEGIGHPLSGPVRTPGEPDALHIDGGFATPSDSTTLVPETEDSLPSGYKPSGDAGSRYIHVDAEVALVVQERSGSPDSIGSDFVEI